MGIIKFMIFLFNYIFASFSLDTVFIYRKSIYLIHTIIFLIMSMIELYIINAEFVLEGIIMFIIFGGPWAHDNLVPSFIKKNFHRLSIILIISVGISYLFFVVL